MKARCLGLAVIVVALAGCTGQNISRNIDPNHLTHAARKTLIAYTTDPSPLLRAHAIEALTQSRQSSAIETILSALDDEHAGVRFAACMALIETRDRSAKDLLIKKLTDSDKSVRAAAAGALHVCGDQRYTEILRKTLFDKDLAVRRNTALILGRMGEPGANKLLRFARSDNDISVLLQVAEAMAILGDKQAQGLMMNYCNSGYDDEAILAMLALAKANCTRASEKITYVYKRSAGRKRLGMRLVAARALAILGDDRGQAAARRALRYRSGKPEDAARIRKLAAMALAEMESTENLGYLRPVLDDVDPDVRISAAMAILKCIGR